MCLTVSVEEAAEMLGIGRSLAYRLCRENNFYGCALKLGKSRWVVSRTKLKALVEGEAKCPME